MLGLKARMFSAETAQTMCCHSLSELFSNSDKPILYPDITYSFYPVWCELLKIPYKTKSVDDDFVINIEDFKDLTAALLSLTLMLHKPWCG